ncbi:RNA polymerase sigma factor [Maribacter sp. 2307ULW6-5]|uniref:RNA polymerase sigma factor n=1 Tax=Maribacter sp. 2307ULW6-5 TaxID=3386275 RepID=UPI0039BD3911
MAKDLEHIFLNALDENQHKLLRICSVYGKDEADTKDLFQEVLVHIWEALPNFKGHASLSTWMYRITLNVCMRVRSKDSKKQKKMLRMDSITINNLKAAPEHTEQSEKPKQLKSCIKQLNEADRAMIALYLEEVAYREIAAVTGLKENTIAVRIKRIKTKLLHCINQAS